MNDIRKENLSECLTKIILKSNGLDAQLDKHQLICYLDVVEVIGKTNTLHLLIPILESNNKCFYSFRFDALYPKGSATEAWLESLEDTMEKVILKNIFDRLRVSKV